MNQALALPRRLGRYERGRAIFIGHGSMLNNPFDREGISKARAAILYSAWMAGEVTPGVLRSARFSEAEIAALERRRPVLIKRLPDIRGHNLRCDCAPSFAWCHGGPLIRLANGRLAA